MNDIAIQVTKLNKVYQLYNQPVDRLKEAFNLFGRKYHTNFNAVKDMSFDILKGETIGIIGRNGCGKSTLLKMITGVLTPSSGQVAVHGHVSAILELGVGFNPEMSGLENIFLNNTINGISREQTNRKLDEILEFSELGEFIHQPIKIYSSGMKARLAFAIAINVEPDILIVDEALSVGDAAFQKKCFSKMEEIRTNGATVLFVSHSSASIVNLCNRAIWLSNGEQVIDGSPKLVTGLYLKHSNAKWVNKEKVRDEYKKLIIKQNEAENKCNDNLEIIRINNEKTDGISDYYSHELKPTSTIYYEENGARISDVMVTTLEGKKVNILIQGKEYIYQYVVNMKAPLKSVQFGFLINTKNGITLGGGAYPDKNTFLDELKKSTRVKIRFRCELNNGEYFLNAGILAKIGEKIDYAHRIIDVLMIKVIDASNQITGPVNFVSNINVEEK